MEIMASSSREFHPCAPNSPIERARARARAVAEAAEHVHNNPLSGNRTEDGRKGEQYSDVPPVSYLNVNLPGNHPYIMSVKRSMRDQPKSRHVLYESYFAV